MGWDLIEWKGETELSVSIHYSLLPDSDVVTPAASGSCLHDSPATVDRLYNQI